MSGNSSAWIVRRSPRPGAAMRLFCFPHAGAGSVIYHDWHSAFGDNVEVCAIEPPGRLARRKEPLRTDVHAFTRDLLVALAPWLDRPFALFGYSLGALMAFECARALRRIGREPSSLMFAAAKAPHLPRRHAPISGETKRVLTAEIERRYGAFDPVLASDPELFDMVLEIMRGDLRMMEDYRYGDEQPFSCPVLVAGGMDDASVTRAEIDAWEMHTSGPFRAAFLPGQHFFLRTSGPMLRDLVNNELRRVAPAAARRAPLDAPRAAGRADGALAMPVARSD